MRPRVTPRRTLKGGGGQAMRPWWRLVWDALYADFSDLPDAGQVTHVVVRLLLAAALGGLLGWERERAGKAAGRRTHMLVALGAAFFVFVPQQAGMSPADLSRVIQGLVAGIGFVGAGAILKEDEGGRVRGLTTAAGIWLTAAVGVAVGLGREASAVLGTLLALLILHLLPGAEQRHGEGGDDGRGPPQGRNVLAGAPGGERAGEAASGPLFPQLRLFRRQLHVPGEAEQGEGADDPVADVDLPPAQAVAGRGREGVVRVVPPLPQRQDAKHDIVAALVVAPVGPEAPQVAGRVDAPRHVVDQEEPDQAAPDQAGPDARPAQRDHAAQHRREHEAE